MVDIQGQHEGPCINHVYHEEFAGRPIAIVENEEEIEININNRKLDLLISHKEIKKQLKEWERPEPKFKTGYLNMYRKIVSSAKNGEYLQ
ncbi:MAG: dihydroxy-acid dehydratase [Candidatus Thorarchaeota archaeon]